MEDTLVVELKEFTSPQHVARKVEECIAAFEGKEITENTNCPCGEESVYGCHGVREGEVYTEYFCKVCYNKR